MTTRIRAGLAALAAVLAAPTVASAQGLYLPGNGAVQGGMAGVSSATPLDAIGALYWNPAAIGRLGHSEASIGGSFIYPDISVSSSVPIPGGGVLAGRTRSDTGMGMAPAIGIVNQEEGSPWTMGMGISLIGGGGVNFPGSLTNPIVAPTAPLGNVLLGPIYSNMQLYQLSPTVAYKVTDRLIIGVAGVIDVTAVSFDPAFFARPNAGVGGVASFPTATHSRPDWGGGFKVGATYEITDNLATGFGYTSPQWLEPWKFYARDNLGLPRTLLLQAQLPSIYSWGISYTGIEKLTLGVDLRYFDYKNCDLFGTPVKNGGLGWDSVFAVATGANYQLTDKIAVRGGYQYNTNPLASTSTLFNVQSPAIIQHTISVGSTMKMTESVALSLGYAYGFKNTITGTAQEVPGAGIQATAASHTILFNIQILYGSCGRKSRPTPTCDSVPAAANNGATSLPAIQ